MIKTDIFYLNFSAKRIRNMMQQSPEVFKLCWIEEWEESSSFSFLWPGYCTKWCLLYYFFFWNQILSCREFTLSLSVIPRHLPVFCASAGCSHSLFIHSPSAASHGLKVWRRRPTSNLHISLCSCGNLHSRNNKCVNRSECSNISLIIQLI